jgi:hypothetical protein
MLCGAVESIFPWTQGFFIAPSIAREGNFPCFLALLIVLMTSAIKMM